MKNKNRKQWSVCTPVIAELIRCERALGSTYSEISAQYNVPISRVAAAIKFKI